MSVRRWFAHLAAVLLVVTGTTVTTTAVAAAGPAHAMAAPTLVYLENNVVHVVASPGVQNNIRTNVETDDFFVVEELAAVVAVGENCTKRSDHKATCHLPDDWTDLVLDAGDQNDQLEIQYRTWSVDNCRINGGAGDDVVRVSGCTVFGDAGNDTIRLSESAHARGGLGNDRINVVSTNTAASRDISGGPGKDLVSFEAATGPVTVTLNDVSDDGQEGFEHINVHLDVEDVDGGAYDDSFAGSAADNTFNGAGGKDFLFGDAGADTLNGGAGNDTLMGGLGIDKLDGGPGLDQCGRGGAGSDGGTLAGCEIILLP
ncbi:bifunctional hemolysin/adenylate cyclase [Embleya hyalina]|uniref:Bifunctional hemolysin/adenylate cyclase n=2 Tax=Embleya hyalina TaxID=516124 RepID=A0A401Z1R2_9ACTN|nr:bifunctional hemolysin/adenylate cyclase [Embleya hyalina]